MPSLRHIRRAAVASLLLACAGCTTDLKQATGAHAEGKFGLAAERVNKMAETKISEKDHEVDGLRVDHEKDVLWVAVEKAKMVEDNGSFKEAFELYRWVYKVEADRLDVNTAHVIAPLNVENWDVSKSLQDAGQSVMGADQTRYLLQPYELVLVKSYMTLDAILNGESARVHADNTKTVQKLVQASPEPDPDKVDAKLRASGQSKVTESFSTAALYGQPGFGTAKKALQEAADMGKKRGAADPSVAFGSLMGWAAYVGEGPTEAETFRKSLAATSGAKTLAKQMAEHQPPDSPDFVLVVVDAGRAPVRDYFSVRLPVPVPKVGLGYFRGVYPFLRFRPEGRPTQITAISDGRKYSAECVDSIDAISAQNFQGRELELWVIPTIRGVLRTAASLAAQAAMKNSNQKNDMSGLVALANILVAEAEQADVRIWSTLPAEQHAVLVPRPKDGHVRIDLSNGAAQSSTDAVVPPGSSVVYMRALSPSLHTPAYAGQVRKPSSAQRSERSAARTGAPQAAAAESPHMAAPSPK